MIFAIANVADICYNMDRSVKSPFESNALDGVDIDWIFLFIH